MGKVNAKIKWTSDVTATVRCSGRWVEIIQALPAIAEQLKLQGAGAVPKGMNRTRRSRQVLPPLPENEKVDLE